MPKFPPLPRPDRGFVKVWAWRLALTVIAPSAAGIVAWSLYVVAHDKYGVPGFLAALVSACFDGAALACLHLASEAVRENRSAVLPRLATLLIAAISVYLNREHALMIDGGVPAIVLFAFPTVALLLLADLSWAATRARHRAARGEQPMRWPVFGWLGWLLARDQAWDAIKQRAVEHVTGQASTAPSAVQHAVHLARVDAPAPPPQQLVITVQPQAIPAAPADDTQPETQHETAPETGVPASGQARQHVPDGTAPDRIIDAALADVGSSKAGAVRVVRAAVPGMSAAEIARHLVRNGIEADAAYVRTVNSRDRKPKRTPPPPQTTPKEGTGLYL